MDGLVRKIFKVIDKIKLMGEKIVKLRNTFFIWKERFNFEYVLRGYSVWFEVDFLEVNLLVY